MEKEIAVLERTHLPVYTEILRDLGIEERISGISPEIDDIQYLEREKDVLIFKETLEKAQMQGHFSWLTIVEVDGELKLINKELAEKSQSESELKQKIIEFDESNKIVIIAGNIKDIVNSIVETDKIKEVNQIIEDFEKTESITNIAEKLEKLFSEKSYLEQTMIFPTDLSGRPATSYESTKKEILSLSPKAHLKLREDIIDELELLKCDIYYDNTVQMISDYFFFEKDNKHLERSLSELENLVKNFFETNKRM